MTNPYGDGLASEKIVGVLTAVPLGEELLMKRHAALHKESGAAKSAGACS
jgi:hypothetical protein